MLQTEITKCSINTKMITYPPRIAYRVNVRFMPTEEFIDKHGSNCLRRNRRLGFTWQSQYLEERVAFEFGMCFQCLPRDSVSFDNPKSGSNWHSNESGVFIDRYLEMNIFEEDIFEAKYIFVKNEIKAKGVGLICKQTSAPFIPSGHVVFGIVCEDWKDTHLIDSPYKD